MRRFALPACAVCALYLSWIVVPRVLAQTSPRPAGWTEATHGAGVRPDYARLFATNRVHEIRITIAAERFRDMQADLRALTPPMPGGRRGFGRPGMNGGDPPALPLLAGARRGGPINFSVRDPIYVPVTVQHDGHVWTNVGMRYKGNSSLMAASRSGTGKIPFRLNFDRHEDDVPAINNQRFYGFQELTFSSNFSDDSQLRELLASEILRDRGVPAPRAAFYRVFVDVGAGPEYWGLYTMVEDPADGAMLDTQFGGRGGNLYKPEGPGADWTHFDPAGFEKKTNEADADFSDVKAAIAALQAPRAPDPASWRSALEARFDVDLFLRWLAVNTAIENWDAYGAMPHNYYLYGDPTKSGRLRWLPWDHNMAFGAGPGRFGGFGERGAGLAPPPWFAPANAPRPPGAMRGFGARSDDVLHEQVGDRWPLIQRLLADEVYAAKYTEHLERAIGGAFAPTAFAARAKTLHAMIAAFVIGDQGERPSHTTVSSPAAFEQAIDGPGGLLEIAERRRELIRAALKK
jgi:hypothetical protein